MFDARPETQPLTINAQEIGLAATTRVQQTLRQSTPPPTSRLQADASSRRDSGEACEYDIWTQFTLRPQT